MNVKGSAQYQVPLSVLNVSWFVTEDDSRLRMYRIDWTKERPGSIRVLM